jgi:hypothetical protein
MTGYYYSKIAWNISTTLLAKYDQNNEIQNGEIGESCNVHAVFRLESWKQTRDWLGEYN